MRKEVLRDHILIWNILGNCLNCGIMIPDAIPAIDEVCNDKTLVHKIFEDMRAKSGFIAPEWNPEKLPPSTAALLQVAWVTTMWEGFVLGAGDLLLRRYFAKDPDILARYYCGRLIDLSLSEENAKKILKLELNVEHDVMPVNDLESLRAQLPIPTANVTPKISFYQKLQEELSIGSGLHDAVTKAAASDTKWSNLFRNLDHGEDSLLSAMQANGHSKVEQIVVLNGLRSGQLPECLRALIRILEIIEVMR